MGVKRWRLLITGGGTGGHIYPALALAKSLAGEAEVLYAGTARGLEARLVPAAGVEFTVISSGGLLGRSLRRKLQGFSLALAGFSQALRLIRRYRPAVVVGTGGYASGPVVLAAVLLRVPTLLQEQNLRPGMTNRTLAPWVSRVAVPYPESRGFFPPRARLRVIGNPVRPEITRADPALARQELGLGQERVVLLFGGSGGARRLNEAALDVLAVLRPGEILLWVTGATYHREFETRWQESGHSKTQVRLYPYLDRMDLGLAAADVVIARAGAMTIAEILALGRPAILVPSPNVVHDHQRGNAEVVAAKGAAVVVAEEALSTLPAEVRRLLDDEGRRLAMAECSRALGDPEALARLGQEVRSLAGRAARHE